MSWWRRKPRRPVAPREWVDLDKDTIRLGDPTDATSLLMTISMRVREPLMVDYNKKDDTWTVYAGSLGEWTGATQLDALMQCDRELKERER